MDKIQDVAQLAVRMSTSTYRNILRTLYREEALTHDELYSIVKERALEERIERIPRKINSHKKTIDVLVRAGLITDKESSLKKLEEYLRKEAEMTSLKPESFDFMIKLTEEDDLVEENNGVYTLAKRGNKFMEKYEIEIRK